MVYSRRSTVWVSSIGVLAVVAYAALGTVQILVLNPLAAAPGSTLPEIRRDLAATGGSLGEELVFGILGIGVVLAVGVAVVALVGRMPAALAAMVFLGLLVVGPMGYFAASFGAGMSLADAYGIGGADYSPWARPLYATSILALVVVIVVAIRTRRSSRPHSGGDRRSGGRISRIGPPE
jgi:hypothetical protein